MFLFSLQLVSEILCFIDIHPGMILVNNQLHAQFFMYVYFYSLHVSDNNVPIIRRIIVSKRHLVYFTVWYAGAYASAYQTVMYTE